MSEHEEITIDDLAQMIARGFNSVDERFDRLEGRVGNLESDVKDIKVTVERIERKQDSQQTILDRHDRRLTALENR